jgi:hypothetical protein
MPDEDEFEYFPNKQHCSSIDKEMSLYNSMYQGEQGKSPLEFWKRNAAVNLNLV